MTRNLFLDFTKGVLILLVTVGHSIQYIIYNNHGFWGDPLFKAIYIFHMPLFIGLSGFLSYPRLQKDELGKYLIGKLRAYIVPVFVWATIFSLGLVAVSRHNAITSLPAMVIREATSTSLWFLWALFGAITVTALARKTGRYFYITYILSFFAVLLLPEKHEICLFKYLFPYFQIGYFCAAGRSGAFGHISELAKKYRLTLVVFMALLSIACYQAWNEQTYIYVSKMSLAQGNWGNIILRYTGGFTLSCVFLYGLNWAYKRLPQWPAQAMVSFGRGSVYIYILQCYVFFVIARFADRLSVPVQNLMIGSILGVCLGTIIAYTCWLVGGGIAKNELLGRLLFGRGRLQTRPPDATSTADALLR